MRKPQFNYYLDWTDFGLGFSITKLKPITGWKWCVTLDITFLSVWVKF